MLTTGMTYFLSVVFWGATFLLLFPYMFYPTLMLLARKRPYFVDPGFEPELTFVIAVHNEESAIARKLENTLGLPYPAAKKHIVVISDCSSDGTDAIVTRYANAGVTLVRLDTRGGKTRAQNAAINHLRGEVVVYSDCSTHLQSWTLSELVKWLSDQSVGVVGANAKFTGAQNPDLAARKRYLTNFDEIVKAAQANVDSLVGVNGALYAVRRSLVTALPEHLTSDFLMPLEAIKRGYRVAFARSAQCSEPITRTDRLEWWRKVRTVRAGVTVAVSHRQMFINIQRPWVSLGLWGTKLLRWLGGILFLAALVCNLILVRAGLVYSITLISYITFLIVAAMLYLVRLSGWLRLPGYLVFLYSAAVAGLWQAITLPPTETWDSGAK